MSGGARTTTTQPWAAQEPYLTRGFEAAAGLYEGGPPAYYGGPTLAGFSPAEEQAQAESLQYLQGPQWRGLQTGAEQAVLGQLGGQTPFSGQQMTDLIAGNVRLGEGTPYAAMEEALQQGVTSNLQRNILPNIRQGLVQYQPGGSSVGNLLQQQAITDAVTKGMTMPLAQMYGSAYGQAQGQRFPAAQMQLGQQQAGIGAYPSIMGAPLGVFEAMGGIGQQQRAMSQEAINRDIARYQYESTAPQTALQNYMAGISGDYGGAITQPGPTGMQSLGHLASIIAPFALGS
jgi:hypothetical protein